MTTLKSKVQKHEDSCKVTGFPDKLGHFGRFGGKFVPETIMPAKDNGTKEATKTDATSKTESKTESKTDTKTPAKKSD